jgi:hypothetical protein
MIALAEPAVSHEERILAIRLKELALKLAERKVDTMNLPYATKRRLERKYADRVDEIVIRAAAECVEALSEALTTED